MLTATKPASVQEQFTSESRVLLRGVSWQTFKALVADIGEDRNCRIAYADLPWACGFVVSTEVLAGS
ncbi:MAG: hypothetical protein GDA48_14085 [Hormoscilla sp. GM102CHS1]|nr:hypothetical protein [Hormoscilla sp. GM102CHS1]